MISLDKYSKTEFKPIAPFLPFVEIFGPIEIEKAKKFSGFRLEELG